MATQNNENIWLVGDVRYTPRASSIFDGAQVKAPVEFLLSLQNLMEEYGVVKLDISTDAFKYASYKSP